MEAIYIASPGLVAALDRFLPGEIKEEAKQRKLIQALARYYIRMNSRCTPFGLFASCSTACWGQATRLIATKRPATRTRLDMFYLCNLVQELSKKDFIRTCLQYFVNNTCYII